MRKTKLLTVYLRGTIWFVTTHVKRRLVHGHAELCKATQPVPNMRRGRHRLPSTPRPPTGAPSIKQLGSGSARTGWSRARPGSNACGHSASSTDPPFKRWRWLALPQHWRAEGWNEGRNAHDRRPRLPPQRGRSEPWPCEELVEAL